MHKKTFNSLVEANNWLNLLKKWKLSEWQQAETGLIMKFRCVITNTSLCRVSAYLFFNEQADIYEFFESKRQHYHTVKWGICWETKVVINDLLANGVTKPKKILQNIGKQRLRDPKIVLPTKVQLANYLNQMSKSKHIIYTYRILVM